MRNMMHIPIDPRYPDKPRPLITNVMKATCIGEFSWTEDAAYYNEEGELIEYEAERTVPWDLCKKIYSQMAMVASQYKEPTEFECNYCGAGIADSAVMMGKFTLDLSEVTELPEHWPSDVRILPIIDGNHGRAFDLDVAAIDSNDYKKLKEAFLKRNKGYIEREDPRLLLPFSMDLSDIPIGSILRDWQ